MWVVFTAFILAMLALDLGVFHRKHHTIKAREALLWSVFWIVLALGFNCLVYSFLGEVKALEFLTGYVLEKSLSVDNLFVFLVIFSFFSVPSDVQHRVLFFGILGAIVLRGIFIGLGVTLIEQFHFVLYIFGVLLLLTAFKLLKQGEEQINPEANPVYRIFRKVVPSVPDFRGSKFFVKDNGRWFATPLFFVLVAIELSDVVFAIDSIPAVFAVTQDPFIVFTSNIFAILGLRALYFLISAALKELKYLKPALSIVLGYVGIKILVVDLYRIPVGLSLGIICSVIGIAIFISIKHNRRISGDKLSDTVAAENPNKITKLRAAPD